MKHRLIAAGCLAGLIISLTVCIISFSAGLLPVESDRPVAPPAMTTASVSPGNDSTDNDADDNIWLVPRIVLDGASSFADWLMLPDQPLSAADQADRRRLQDFDGLFSPEMQPHWDAFASHPNKHYLKNIGSEWVRLDPQRAYKTLSFVLVAGSLLVMLMGLAAGIGIGLVLRADRPMPRMERLWLQ